MSSPRSCRPGARRGSSATSTPTSWSSSRTCPRPSRARYSASSCASRSPRCGCRSRKTNWCDLPEFEEWLPAVRPGRRRLRKLIRRLTEAWIVGAVRTPIGRHGGSLSPVRPDDLGAVVLGALMERTGIEPGEVEDVYLGCANQAGEDNRNVARMSLLLAGFPETVAGATVNRLCGSGL